MKKSLKILVSVLLLCVFCTNMLPISAADLDTPVDGEVPELPLENCIMCTFSFDILSDGRAKVYVDYMGKSATFTQAKITAKIQKHVFLFIWTDVAVNENNQWVVYSTNVNDNIRLTHQLTSTGTYRAVITAEFYGTTGVTDTLNETIECNYN